MIIVQLNTVYYSPMPPEVHPGMERPKESESSGLPRCKKV